MPRSYSFDHFTANKQSVGRSSDPEQAKQRYLESELAKQHGGNHGGVHYGHRFAETQEKLHERAESYTAPRAASAEDAPAPEARKAKREAKPSAQEASPLEKLWQDARESAGTVVRSTREGRAAAFRLVRLPWEAVRIVAHEVGRLGQRLTG